MHRGGGGRASGSRGGRGSGRGEYYKNKYGGGGRGRGSGGGGGRSQDNAGGRWDEGPDQPAGAHGGGSYDDLQRCLQRIDGKSYGAYHDLDTPENRGWTNSSGGFTLFVGSAQSDPFAPPTRCRVVVQASTAGFPPALHANRIRSMALSDYVLRSFYHHAKQLGADATLATGSGGGGWSGPKGGDIQILEPCQHVLEQSAIRIDSHGNVIAQLTINLPARGRSILGAAAWEILGHTLPTMIQRGLCYPALNATRLQSHVESVEDQAWVQRQLESRALAAFIANGAILPRKSGVDDRPMDASSVVRFQSPERLQISFTLPNAGSTISGMGIPKGIFLICGGGFHGKSTLLEAIQVGVYLKIPGDGREFCVTSSQAFKIRAEDGRSVQSVDISTFINNLPFGKDTTCFSTPDASGSTSQATNIIEAIEVGADTLLIDEDTCATNFMIRDEKMIQLVAHDKEPITPYVRVVRSLYDESSISTIMVVGGVGDYFDVADNVVVMDCYKCTDVTERAKQIVANGKANQHGNNPSSTNHVPFKSGRPRVVNASSLAANGKVKVNNPKSVFFGDTELDLSGLEQVVNKSQTAGIANAIQRLPNVPTSDRSLYNMLKTLDKCLDENSLDYLAPGQFHGDMSRPRLLEIAGAINRLRRAQAISQSK